MHTHIHLYIYARYYVIVLDTVFECLLFDLMFFILLILLLSLSAIQPKPDTLAARRGEQRKGYKNTGKHTMPCWARIIMFILHVFKHQWSVYVCVRAFGLVPTSKSMFICHHSPCETMWNGMHSDFGCALPSSLSSSQIIILFPCYTTLTHIYSKKSTQHREYKNNKQLFIFVLYGCHYNYYHLCSLSIIFVSFMNFQLTSSSHLAPLTKWYFNEEIHSFHI